MWGGGGGVRRARGRVPSPSCGCFQEEEEEVPRKKEKMVFSVRLTELKAADKVKLIKEVKNFVPGVNLVQVRRALPTRTAPAALGPLPCTGRFQSTSQALASLPCSKGTLDFTVLRGTACLGAVCAPQSKEGETEQEPLAPVCAVLL